MITLDRLLSLVMQVERSGAALDIAKNMAPQTQVAAEPQVEAPAESADFSEADIASALRVLQGRLANPPMGAAATLLGLRTPGTPGTAPVPTQTLSTLVDASSRMEGIGSEGSDLATLPLLEAAGTAASRDTETSSTPTRGLAAAGMPAAASDAPGRTVLPGASPGVLPGIVGETDPATNAWAAAAPVVDNGREIARNGTGGASPDAAVRSSDERIRPDDRSDNRGADARASVLAERISGTSVSADVDMPGLSDASGGDRELLSDEIAAIFAKATQGGQQTERAGIIASFILNAAMIPGWPGDRRFQSSTGGEAARWSLPALPSGLKDTDLVTYLANVGLRQGLFDRLVRGIKPLSRRLRMMLGLSLLLTRIKLVLKTLKDELQALAEEEEDPLAEKPTRKPARWRGVL